MFQKSLIIQDRRDISHFLSNNLKKKKRKVINNDIKKNTVFQVIGFMILDKCDFDEIGPEKGPGKL